MSDDKKPVGPFTSKIASQGEGRQVADLAGLAGGYSGVEVPQPKTFSSREAGERSDRIDLMIERIRAHINQAGSNELDRDGRGL